MDKILNAQAALQTALGYNFASMTIEDTADYIKEYTLHVEHELHEMLTELPFFKKWKKYDKSPASITTAMCKAKAEFIDAFTFMMNIALALGFDASDLCEQYFDKNNINFKRQCNTEEYKPCIE